MGGSKQFEIETGTGKAPTAPEPIEDTHHDESVKCSPTGVAVFLLGLVSGTFSALLCKMAYDSKSVGLDGQEKLFAKPIMMLLLMFAAMCPAGIMFLVQQAFLPESKREHVSWKTMGILVVPSVCDLLCTLLLLIAQLYITASMWQMMRGSVMIITALLKKYALGHNLTGYMWQGIGVITFAMILVASTNFFGPQDPASNTSSKNPLVGVVLVVLGCLAQGVQYVFEEKVLSVGAPPLVVISCEGFWGTLLTVFVVYPLAYSMPGSDNGSFEDPWDAIEMIRSSPYLSALTVGFVVTVTCYNCAVIYVTKVLSAIWHAILDNFRPVSIWGLDLCIYYILLPGKGYGEVWTNASWLQLSGLLILFWGTYIYNGGYSRTDEYEPVGGVATTGNEGGNATRSSFIKTSAAMSSPALSRSPLIYGQQREAQRAQEAQKLMSEKKNRYNELA